jgi:hypothetical protein
MFKFVDLVDVLAQLIPARPIRPRIFGILRHTDGELRLQFTVQTEWARFRLVRTCFWPVARLS